MVIMICDHPQDQNKEEDYDEYGHHNHPLAHNQDKEYCGHHYYP